ncbi:MAG: hypothetical protein V4675_09985 [Verrucomicrobiota bacterium]
MSPSESPVSQAGRPVRRISLILCDDCLSPAPEGDVNECPICARPVCADCQPDHRHSEAPINLLGQCGGN